MYCLFDGAEVIRRILKHLGLWAPLERQGAPPTGQSESWSFLA